MEPFAWANLCNIFNIQCGLLSSCDKFVTKGTREGEQNIFIRIPGKATL